MAAPHRPPDLTPKIRKAVAAQVARGVPLKHAARRAGTSPRSLYRWLARGRVAARKPRVPAADKPYVALLAAVKKGEADAVARHVGVIEKAAKRGVWTASAWWLERTHPEEFAADRRELRDLKKVVADLTDRLARLAPPDATRPTPPNGPTSPPPA
jgi:hypothetical protein